jgi:hypothetical protein
MLNQVTAAQIKSGRQGASKMQRTNSLFADREKLRQEKRRAGSSSPYHQGASGIILTQNILWG